MDPLTRTRRLAALLVAAIAAGGTIACGRLPAPSEAAGIEIVGLRLSAAGHLIDLRYRVRDAEKAAPLFDRGVKPILVHAASGARMRVPATRMGSMRQAGFRPDPERVYGILFGNAGKVVKPGDDVALEAGPLHIEEIRVE